MPFDGSSCMLCGSNTSVSCGYCGHKKPNDQYTQVEVSWTNGSKMMIGLCVTCANKNLHGDPETKAKITKLHHDEWDRQGHKHDKGIVIA